MTRAADDTMALGAGSVSRQPGVADGEARFRRSKECERSAVVGEGGPEGPVTPGLGSLRRQFVGASSGGLQPPSRLHQGEA